LSASDAKEFHKELSLARNDLETANNNLSKERKQGGRSSQLNSSRANLELRAAQHKHNLYLQKQSGSIWRNLILPGWGHHYQENRARGYMWMGAAAASLGYFYYQNTIVEKRTKEYLDYTPLLALQPVEGNDFLIGNYIYSKRASNLRKSQNDLSAAGAIILGVWVGSLLDLSFQAGVDKPSTSDTNRVSWKNTRLRFAAQFQF
jgi:hypothetical protein